MVSKFSFVKGDEILGESNMMSEVEEESDSEEY